MSKSISVTNIPTIALVSILVSLILVTGCTTTITQDYKHKISMSKDEAIKIILKDLSIYTLHRVYTLHRDCYFKDKWLIDEDGISGTLRCKEYLGCNVDRLQSDYNRRVWVNYYRQYDCSYNLAFADVGTIERYDSLGKPLFYLYKNKSADWDISFMSLGKDTDEVASAFLRLCPNVGPVSSNVTRV